MRAACIYAGGAVIAPADSFWRGFRKEKTAFLFPSTRSTKAFASRFYYWTLAESSLIAAINWLIKPIICMPPAFRAASQIAWRVRSMSFSISMYFIERLLGDYYLRIINSPI